LSDRGDNMKHRLVSFITRSPRSQSKSGPADQNLKWTTLFAIALTLLCGARIDAQQNKLPKIGWLYAISGSNRGQEEVIRRLCELGHVEGKTVAYVFRYADNQFERLPALADELVRLKIDLLVTPGTPGALAFLSLSSI